MISYFFKNAEGNYGKLLLAIFLGTLTILSSVGLMGVSAYLIILAGFHPSLAVLQIPIVGVRVFGISRSFFRYLERLSSHNSNFELVGKIRLRIFDNLSNNFSKIMDRYSSSEIFAFITADMERIENLFIRIIFPWAVAFTTSILVGLFFGLQSLEIAFIYLSGIVITTVLIPFLSIRKGKITKIEVGSAENEFLLAIINFYQFLGEAKFYQIESKLTKDLSDNEIKLYSKQRIDNRWEAIWNGLTFLFTQMVFLLLLFVSASLVNDGKLESIFVGVISLAALASFEIISNLSANSYHIQEIKTSIDRLSEIQEFQKESKELSFEPVSEIFPIKLENVSYSYQANDNFVLRNISIDIDQGEKIAIIGSNGSGKSTLTELLIGNRNDYSGDILFNGVERKKISDDSLRSKIIKLSAHPYFFNTTVRNNLLLAKKNATDDELRQVLAKVNLLNPPLIDLDSEIEEMGKNYSTGELQKLAFAQMLLQNGELLIFDEPFSNLDPVVTKIFFGYVEEFFKNKTIIFISHDYSHLDRFDKIYVMDHGKIIKKTGNSKG